MKVSGVIIAYKNLEQAKALAATTWGLEYWDNTEKNENIHRIWNRYLKTAATEFFLILNPDTRPEPGWIEKMLYVFKQHPRIAAVGPSTDHCYNEQANRHPAIVGLAGDSWVPQVLIPGFCTLYRTEVVRELGGFREDFTFYGGDLDLAYRLQLGGWLTAWAVSAFVWHEWGGAAKALGDEAYRKLRETGNRELQRTLQSYRGQVGLWIARPGGGVDWRDFHGQEVVQVQGEEDVRGE